MHHELQGGIPLSSPCESSASGWIRAGARLTIGCEDDVEHCEVAQRRHPTAVGHQNERPEKGCQQDFPLV